MTDIYLQFVDARITDYTFSSVLTMSSYRRHLTQLREFLALRNVPTPMRRKLVAQYEHYFSQKTVFNERSVVRAQRFF